MFSKGEIKLKDKKQNTYKFNQLYIDEKKKIIGSDAKIYFNDGLKADKRNNPRIFANSISISEGVTSVKRSVYILSI